MRDAKIDAFAQPAQSMKRLLLAAALSAQLALVSTAASASVGAGAGADDTRFEAIYGKEWKWRQEQTGEADEDNDTSGNSTDCHRWTRSARRRG